jgi:membrane associated rhomboid family serine protease
VFPIRDRNPTSTFASVTLLLIVVNIGVYFGVQPGAAEVEATAAFNYERAAIPCELTTGDPLSVDEIVATVQTGDGDACGDDGPELFPHKSLGLSVLASMFFHGSLLHLVGNMIFLWVFGNNVEDRLGHLRYAAFYLVAGFVATFAHVAFQPDSTIPVIGASGAIAGVMGAYLVWYPNARILAVLGFIPLLLRAKWLLGFWFLSQFFIGPNDGVAWVAHVGGFVFGVLAGFAIRGRRTPRLRTGGPFGFDTRG